MNDPYLIPSDNNNISEFNVCILIEPYSWLVYLFSIVS